MKDKTLLIRLSEPEKKRLGKTAKDLGKSMSEMIRLSTFLFAGLDSTFYDGITYIGEQTGLHPKAVLEALVFDCISDLTYGAPHNTPEKLEEKIKHISWINRIIILARSYGKAPTEAIDKAKFERTQ